MAETSIDKNEICATTSHASLLSSIEEYYSTYPDLTIAPLTSMNAFCIDHLLSPSECAALIAEGEKLGFGKTNYPRGYRDNLRLSMVDISLACVIWERLSAFLPPTIVTRDSLNRCIRWRVIGLNECWRFAKYGIDDQFAKHVDDYFARPGEKRYTDVREMSFYTVNIYLNSYDGGATRFYADFAEGSPILHSVIGTTGNALVFRQPTMNGPKYVHDGAAVQSGCKYLLRSDVMYSRD